MAATTNIPPLTWTLNGWSAPLDDAILAGTQADFQAAFGGTLNFTTSTGSITNPTPQGQLAESYTAVVSATYDLVMLYTAMVDPAYSRGRMHDAIGRIYFLSKFPSTASLLQLTCIGAGGTDIPYGAPIYDANGVQWTCSQEGTIDNSGSLILPFMCSVDGPVACPAGSANSANGAQIGIVVPGWDAIQNVTDASIGTLQETDQAFEQRRSVSTALNSKSWTAAMTGALLATPGVIDAYVIENLSSAPATIMGATLEPWSVWMSVVGGAQPDVGATIFAKHSPGCPMNGNTSFVVYDTQEGYSAPYPSYTMIWETPIDLPFVVQVSVKNLTVPSNAQQLVQNAISLAFSGQDLQGYDINGNAVYGQRCSWPSVFADRFVPTVNRLWPGEQLVDIMIGSPNNPSATMQAAINGTTLSVSSLSQGAVAIGQTVMDLTGTVLPGTTVIGGAGTSWQVSTPQVVTSEVMFGVVPVLKEVDVNLSQYPAIASSNVSVVLV